MNTVIRKANEADVKTLTKLSHITFREAYGEQNTREDMEFFLSNNFSEAWTLADIEDSSTVYYLAFAGNKMVGYVKLRSMAKDLLGVERPVMEMKRIYVLASHYGKGIAQELLKVSVQYTRQQGLNEINLAVWKENPRAIAFYKKSGFIINGETSFDWGTGKIDSDWVMVLHL